MATQQNTHPSKILMWIYFFGFLFIGMSAGIAGPTLPYLAEQIKVGLDTYSYLFIIASVGGILGALIGARSFDRWPGHKIMSLTLFGMAIFLFLTPLAPSFTLMALIVSISGFFHITFDTGGNTLLIWWWGDKVSPHMNTMHFMFGVGAIISPLLVGQVLANFQSMRLAYWIIAALGIILAIALLFYPSPPIPTNEKDENAETSKSQMALVRLFILLFILYVGVEVGFGNWVYTYAIETNLTDAIQGTYLTSLFWGGLTLGRLISIPLAARVRTEILLWGSVFGSVASAMLMLLVPSAIWFGVALLGLAYASIFPLTVSWAASAMPISGKTNGLFFAGANVGAMIFPWLIGQAFVAIDPVVLIWATLIVGLGMVVVMALLQRKINV